MLAVPSAMAPSKQGSSASSLRAPASSIDGHTAFAPSVVPQSPSQWVHDSARHACKTCHTPFSFFVRRHHCRFCKDVFCDACTDYRLLTKDPKEPTLVVSQRACRACFDACKGRRRRTPATPSPHPNQPATTSTTTPATHLPTSGAASLAPKPDVSERAAYYVRRQPSDVGGTGATEAETEDSESSEGGDEVIVEDDEELLDFEFPVPSPSLKPPTVHPDPSQSQDAGEDGSKLGTAQSKRVADRGTGDKDEFERTGTERGVGVSIVVSGMSPREAELLAIPSDALGSGKRASQLTLELPLVRSSEESYEERNVEKRHIAPPSPITGVQDLLELTSPSALPQPLLNSLNDPNAKPEDVAAVAASVNAGTDQQQQPTLSVHHPALAMFSPRTGMLLSKAAKKAPAPLPTAPKPATDAASTQTLPAEATASSVDANAPTVERTTAAAELVDAVMEDAHLTHEAPITSVREQVPQAAASVQGMGSDTPSKRYVVRRRRVIRRRRSYQWFMRPLPLAMLGAGFLLLFALLPLMVTLPLSIALAAAPVVYVFLRPAAPAPRLSVTRDFPALTADHEALLLKQRLMEWDRADQRLDGLAALPSPSLSQHYASQTEAAFGATESSRQR